MQIYELNDFYGVVDKKLIGLEYASGTNIIMSQKMVQYMIDNKDQLDRTIVDDVAIGLYAYNNRNDLKINLNLFDNKYFAIIDNTNQIPISDNIILYRNRNPNRKDDIVNMKKICQLLQ